MAAKISGSPSTSASPKKRSDSALPVMAGRRGILVQLRLEEKSSNRSAQLGDAPGMATAFKGRLQKVRKAILRRLDADEATAEGEDIRIVMLARQPSRQAIMARRGAHAGVAVRRDRNADPGTANENPPSGAAVV